MRLIELKKVNEGKFIVLYNAYYINEEGNEKKYEFVSRNKNLTIDDFGKDGDVQAAGIIVFNKEKTKILLQREFRLACNHWVYNFPGGLIDANENVEEAARRELKEETGLDLIEITDILKESYTAVGVSDEKVKTIIGIADGNFNKSTSADEEIEAGWYSKEEIEELLKTEYMSLRTQSFCYLWSNL